MSLQRQGGFRSLSGRVDIGRLEVAMLSPGTRLDIGDHAVEVLGNPEMYGDRYVLKIEADPGGPGIKGDFPHLHPSLVETFTCISGSMTTRVGRTLTEVPVGATVEVEQGQVHGFLNTGTDQLIVESELIFPAGYDPSIDLMVFAAVYDRLRRERPVGDKADPSILQMAVLTRAWKGAIRPPGFAGILMPALAALGRLAGYTSDPFDAPGTP